MLINECRIIIKNQNYNKRKRIITNNSNNSHHQNPLIKGG